MDTKTDENLITLAIFRRIQFRFSGKVFAKSHETEVRTGAWPAGHGHDKVQFNIRPEVNAMITRDAAEQEITKSQYIENLMNQRPTVGPRLP